MVEIVLGVPGWLMDKIKEVLKNAGKQAAISLCESHLPFGNIYCGPIIDGLIH